MPRVVRVLSRTVLTVGLTTGNAKGFGFMGMFGTKVNGLGFAWSDILFHLPLQFMRRAFYTFFNMIVELNRNAQ